MLTQQFLWQALWAPGSLPTPRTVLLCEGGRQDPPRCEGSAGGGRKPRQLGGFGETGWPQGFLEQVVPERLVTLEAMNARTRSSGSPLAESGHLGSPAQRAAGGLQGAQELLSPQAALPIPTDCCKAVGKACTGLAGVKLPTLQSQPDQLCC